MGKRRSAPRPARVALVVVATLVAFLPALRGGFVWDDDGYVRNDPEIRSLAPGSLAHLATSVRQGNYHPLTIGSYALEYAAVGLEPLLYHLVNLLLHACNVFLVYRLVLDLSKREDAALVGASFWGLHPLRVESVAWVSGRKDLLYTAFFLVALLAYRRHVRTGSTRAYAASIGAFLGSLLSKGMAVALSLVLPLSDFLDRRPTTRKSVLDKAPFLVLSIAFGAVAIWAQHQAQAVEVDAGRPLVSRMVLAAAALSIYVGKTAWPAHLSALVPYPVPPGAPLPLAFYGLATATAAGIGAVALSLRFTRKIAFGFLFFVATTVLVLQLLPVGNALTADRYTYLSSVGLAYLVGEGWVWARARFERSGARRWKHAPAIAAVAIFACLGAASWARCGVWRDAVTLWTDVIGKHPTAYSAFLNRGNALADRGDRAGARRDYDEAIRLKPDYLLAHYDRAYVDGETGDFAAAADGFSKVLSIDPDMVWARLYRGDAYLRVKRFQEAIADYDRAIQLAPDLAPAYEGRARAWLLLGDRDRARADAARAQQLGLEPDANLRRALGER